MKQNGQLWIDLTDMVIWKGSFTGIQRVTFCYAERFAKQGAKFFVYSTHGDRFYEVGADVLETLGKEVQPDTKRQLVKERLLKKYKTLPVPVRRVTSHPLRTAHRAFRKGAALVLDNREDDSFRNMTQISFHENDTVLVLGAAWNEGGIVDALARYKAKTDFKLAIHLNDVLPILQPQLFADDLPPKFTSYVLRTLKIADVITVISKASYDDLAIVSKKYGLKMPPTKIIRLGEDIVTEAPQKVHEADLSDNFLLAVGTFEIRKNYYLLYQAIKLAKANNKTLPQIVIVGKRGWLTKDLEHVIKHDPDLKGKLLFISKASDAELRWLYRNAMFTLFPSLCEGWGLPVVESLQNGKFCLSSGVSSMLEMPKDMIDYFSPYDPQSVISKIEEYVKNGAYKKRNDFIQKNYKAHTWDASFNELQEAIR